jgi:gamma-glutamyl-gamma-aminobutyrate hydrolase PuuD
MARKLLIGMSPRILRQVPPELGFRGKTLQYLEQSVAHWVMALGAMVVMVPTVEKQSVIRRADVDIPDVVELLDGLILQGGADLHPKLYGEPKTHSRGAMDDTRDRFELELLRAFAAAGKPVLGVCRGMQLINVAFGGSLYQDLELDGATGDSHVLAEAYDEHTHPIALEGWFREIHGVAEGRINSIHHQGVKRLGAGLAIEARAPDGVVEAIRGTGANFIVGVQWHPEFHDGRIAGLLSADPLLRAFLDAAQRARR